MKEKKQRKEERRRRKAAAKAAGASRAGGEPDEESARVRRPPRRSLTDWRVNSVGTERSTNARSSPGDFSSLVGNDKLLVKEREADAEKFYRQVRRQWVTLRDDFVPFGRCLSSIPLVSSK